MTKKFTSPEAAEIWEILRKSAEEFDRRQRKADAELRQFRREFGNYADTESRSLEEEFRDALNEAGELCGARLDGCFVRAQPKRSARKPGNEYDLVAVNSDTVFVGEIKRKLTAAKVRDFAAKKLPRFAKDFPKIARGQKIFGMVGGAVIEEDAAEAARELGIPVLRLKNRKLAVTAPVHNQ